MDLHFEDDVAKFLGVHIDRRDDGTIELTQTGLIDCIIDALGLDGATPKKMPTECGALALDKEGDPCNADFNYASVVGMMMYLCSNT